MKHDSQFVLQFPTFLVLAEKQGNSFALHYHGHADIYLPKGKKGEYKFKVESPISTTSSSFKTEIFEPGRAHDRLRSFQNTSGV